MKLPLPLREWLEERVELLRAACADSGSAFPATAQGLALLSASVLASDYAFEQWRRRPELLALLDGMQHSRPPEADDVATLVDGADGEIGARLRRYRHAHSLRLIARDAGGISRTGETLADSSRLAEVCLDAAIASAEAALARRREPSLDRHGQPLRLAVIGMGKLGGGELNFSSDIDLIFAHADPDGDADDAENAMARLGQRVINLLSTNEADGFVHRVDMRLRPFGSVGRLALARSPMEQYYQREGRDWERYAWVKARAVAGDRAQGRDLITALRPFVFRRYLDYAAIDSLREMKALIDAEVLRADRLDDIKLGPGGIREIEFLVQLTQLTRGGREPGLAVPGLLPALEAARAIGAIPEALASMLADSYRLLRKVENRIQMLRDEQVHRLPDAAMLRQRIASGLGFEDPHAFERHVAAARERVANAFADTLLPARGATHARGPGDASHVAARSLWSEAVAGRKDSDVALALGLEEETLASIHALAGSAALRALSERHRARCDRLLPALIASTLARDDGAIALPRILALVRAISGRPSYIALLDEEPAARERVIDVFGRSGFLAEQIIAHPLLLDDLLDARASSAPGKGSGLEDVAIEQQLSLGLARAGDDVEERFNALHEIKLARQFRIGLDWLAQRTTADGTALQLACLADGIAAAAHALALEDVRARERATGAAPAFDGGDGLLMLGYGSLGAMEFGFASDLDLVFVYDTAVTSPVAAASPDTDDTRGFTRRVQRTLHWLTTPMRAGGLYAVDMRLRPDGAKGLLVSSFKGFVDYQGARAWTWEQQALVRARAVAGDARLRQAFAVARRERLMAERDGTALRADVSAMRLRWRTELNRSDAAHFDLKQGVGGLVDLEFLLQYIVLAHAATAPELTGSTRTRDLIALAATVGVLDGAAADALARAHETLLAASLNCTLDLRSRVTLRTPALEAAAATILAVAQRYGVGGQAGDC